MTSVYLRPFSVDLKSAFTEDFNPADPDFDRSVVVSYMKEVAEQSSQNLKRNADAFLSSINHDNEKLLWPGGKRIQPGKFVLTYYFILKTLAVTMNKTEKIFHVCFTKTKTVQIV